MIPRSIPTYQYADLMNNLKARSWGDVQKNLRARLRDLYGVRHVFLLNSAREAIYAILKAYARPGGVLLPAYNCIVVPEAVLYAGYNPVFVDNPDSAINVSAEAFKLALSPGITVVFATHLFGIPCDIKEITKMCKQNGVLVVEDAAPAVGAIFNGQIVGSFGDAAVLSFHAAKVISGEGGGALLTNDDDLADKITRVIQAVPSPSDGWSTFVKAMARKFITSPNVYSMTHFGYRLLRDENIYEVVTPHDDIPQTFLQQCSDFSSGIVLAQLDRLDWNLARRRKIAEIYQEGLDNIPWLKLPSLQDNVLPAWIQFPIFLDAKKAFYKYMQQNGIDVSWTYRYSCPESFNLDGFPNAQRAAKTVIGLPTYPSLSDESAKSITRIVKNFPAPTN